MKQEKIYYTLSNYNRARALNEIEKMIVQDGGEILKSKYCSEYEIHARTNETDSKKRKLIEALETVCRIDCGIWGFSLHYIKNNYLYNIDYDNNPFFPIYYSKIKISDNGSYVGTRYKQSSDAINQKTFAKNKTFALSFGYDNLFKICNDDEIKEIAIYHYQQIKNIIEAGNESEIVHERKRIYYERNRYYYDYIYDTTKHNIYNDSVRA